MWKNKFLTILAFQMNKYIRIRNKNHQKIYMKNQIVIMNSLKIIRKTLKIIWLRKSLNKISNKLSLIKKLTLKDKIFISSKRSIPPNHKVFHRYNIV
jgi:hypothetical protein